MSKKSFIDSVEVKSPCTEDWERMHGNDRVRFCDHCAKDVNDLSQITRKQAMRLVRASGGNLCIRYRQDPFTKRPLFAEQLLQITSRTPSLAAGVMTASVGLSTLSYAQEAPRSGASPLPTIAVKENTADLKTEKNVAESPRTTGGVSGTLKDANGAVIPNMTVTIVESKTNATQSAVSNGEGFFEFMSVDSGEYTLVVPPQKGFGSKEISSIHILDRQTPLGDVVVDVGQIMGGVAISVEYAQPLNRAVADDDVDMVRLLIAKGENVNGKDENYDKITPLFVAVEHGNIEIVQFLLDAGAKVNARDGEKQTPLMRLDDDATPELVELLLRHGAKINLTDNDNNTALIEIAGRVTTEVLKAIIDAGADVNVLNKAGQTALMNAANADSLEKVRLLLEAGAQVNLKNNEGDNAWDMASDDEVKELLARYGAEVKIKPVETTAEPQEAQVPDDM